jgi:hypothetical protein
MVINFSTHRNLGEGVYSVVYEVEARAFKLFKRYPEVPPRQTEAGRRLTFQHQCEAYDRASSDPFLKNHIATYFGPFVIDDVVDADENSVKDAYLLDCCYAVEVMGGRETKTASALQRSEVERYPHIREAVNRFAGIGVEFLDSSVFDADDPEHFKFIDFELPFY